MSKPNDNALRTVEAAAAEAADWYARLRTENVSEMDAARFRAWIAADPSHRREFEAIDDFWDDLEVIAKSPEVLQERAAIARRRAATTRNEGSAGRSGVVWAAAAALLLVVGVMAWTYGGRADRYVTGVGEQRIETLSDGSVITLNTATDIRLHFSPDQRGVELVSGQANFEVAKDAARPFIVTAGNRSVRAVGTQFDVFKSGDKVTVTLIEGKVAVTPAHASPAPAPRSSSTTSDEIVLAAGEQVSYGLKSAPTTPRDADIPRVEAWRARKLDFSDTPLIEAIAEANRYSRVQIVLDAPALKDARISGRFEAGRNDLFAEGLEGYFHFHVERSEDGRIVLRPGPLTRFRE
jgi:transmembrane sensor